MKVFITILLTLVVILSVIPKSVTYGSTSKTIVCSGLSEFSGSTCSKKTAGSSIDRTLALVLNLITAIAGLMAVFAIIIAGLRYVTSGGASDKTEQAKNTILYAVVGILIVAIAQIIVKFALHSAAKL
jgi:hypothetical protein